MRYAVIGSLLATWLTMPLTDAHATTVFPEEQKCPVCNETFITTAIGSYSSFGEPERDLSDAPFVRFDGVEVCPYCLFSSLKSDFEALSALERNVLRLKTPPTLVALQEPERATLLAHSADAWLRGEHFFGHLLARQCYSWRKKDRKRDMRLLLHLYYSAKWERCEDLCRYYRKQCVAFLSSLLADRTYKGAEEAVHTYLLGELTRLEGRDQEAVGLFAKATKLARALPKPKNEEDDSHDWVEVWAFEQTCRIQFVTNSVNTLALFINTPESKADDKDYRRETERNVAIQTLGARQDPEAWTALAEYVMKDPWRLDTLDSLIPLTAEKLKIDVRLWKWVEQRYQEALRRTAKPEQDVDLIWIRTKNRFRRLFNEPEWDFRGSETDANTLGAALAVQSFDFTQRRHEVEPGDTLTSIGLKYGLDVERLLELNPKIENQDKIASPMDVKCLKMPCAWPEHRVLGNLDRLFRAGHTNAISFFLGWTETVGKHSFEEFDYRIARCLSGLSEVTPSWRVPPQDRLGANRQQKIIHDCLALIHGEADAGQNLLPYIDSTNKSEVVVVLASMTAIRDPSAKKAVLGRLKNKHDCDFDMHALDYLTAVATTNDIQTLKKIAIARCPNGKARDDRDMAGFHRKRIEEAILRISLRGVVQRSVGD